MPDDLIVRTCAPTLAGLKAGNLFAYHYADPQELLATVEAQNRRLNGKGVYFALVKMREGFALVYVYRKNRVEEILTRQEIRSFLAQFGYTRFTLSSCLETLGQRLLGKEFPHEIGVFLDYPLEDIQAFILNKGANCPLVGCWKAYTNVQEAMRKFNLFDKCTAIYTRQYFAGTDITGLTVAG